MWKMLMMNLHISSIDHYQCKLLYNWMHHQIHQYSHYKLVIQIQIIIFIISLFAIELVGGMYWNEFHNKFHSLNDFFRILTFFFWIFSQIWSWWTFRCGPYTRYRSISIGYGICIVCKSRRSKWKSGRSSIPKYTRGTFIDCWWKTCTAILHAKLRSWNSGESEKGFRVSIFNIQIVFIYSWRTTFRREKKLCLLFSFCNFS